MVSGSFLDFGYATYPGPSNVGIIDQSGKRERTKFNDAQLQQLEQMFRRCQYPQGHDREELANRLGLTETKVQVWFKNRRAKQRANDKFEKLRRESALAQATGNGNKRLSSNNNVIATMNSTNLMNPGGEFLLSSLDSKIDGLSLSPNNLITKSAFGDLKHNFGNNIGASKDELHGSVGETEDENEGPVLTNEKKIKTVKSDAETNGNCTASNFPVSMPMIPIPTPSFDIKPLEAASAVAASNNVASMNAAAAAAAAAAMLEPSSAFFPPTAAAMAAAAAVSNSPPTSSTNLWNFPYQNTYSQATSQIFNASNSKTNSFTNNEFISSMAAASSFPLAHTSWMAQNYSPSAMLNMNMIAPAAYGFSMPTTTGANSSTAINAGSYYSSSMPQSMSIAAAYDLYNSQSYYPTSANSF